MGATRVNVAGYTRNFIIDQGTVLGMDSLFAALYNQSLSDPKRQGICTGLSMVWAARMMLYHSETPKERFEALHSVGAYRWGGKTQDIHLVAGGGGNIDSDATWRSHYADSLKAYVLKISNGSSRGFGFSDAKTLANKIAPGVKEKHAYRLWNIGLKTAGGNAGHMVASYASSGKILGIGRHLYFFDPNMGEYKVDLADTGKFTAAWIEAYAKGFAGVNYLATFGVERGLTA